MKALKFLAAGLFLAVLLASGAMAASPALTDLTYEVGEQGASVSLQAVEGGYALFLPSSAHLTALTFQFEGQPVTLTVGRQSLTVTSGQPFDLAALYPNAPADGVYALTLSRGSQRLPVKIMVSEHIGSMYITSADPVNKGRSYVEQVKGNKATGQMILLGADGSVIYDGALTQIKGRGNSTWDWPKKPYQIKLDKKTDLLETGDPNEAAKTWVLLANYYDEAFIRNSLSYDLAAELGMPYSPNNRPIDLYYDGEYRGTYLLSEKTEVGSARVDIHDLEGDFEDANPQVDDFDDLPTATGSNAYGNLYQYVTGLNDPDDLSGGYLLEIDYSARAVTEKSFFTTFRGYYIVSKSPEYLSQNAVEYISEFYQEFEDAVFNGGVNPTTGKSYTDYVDLESLAKSYLILELSQNLDAFRSSTFFYKPAGEDKLYAGPVWDYDRTFGISYADCSPTDIFVGSTSLCRALLSIPSFCQAVEDIYQNELNRLVTDVALSTDPSAQTGRLRSIAGYSAEVAASLRMDHLLWPEGTSADQTKAVDFLRSYLSRRNQFLSGLQWADVASTLPLFLDVPVDSWYFSAVEYVVNKGLFTGTATNAFSPQLTLTRAMAATVLYRLAGEPNVADTSSFPDVVQNQWYTRAIAWAKNNDIIQGYPDGLFHPDRELTRQELVVILYRYTKGLGHDVTAPAIPGRFLDRDSVADWAVDAFDWAIDRGIITGTSSTECSPGGYALRCTAAAIFQRYDNVIGN